MRAPPLSAELEMLLAPHREPSPLPPFVVVRVMARAAATGRLPHGGRRPLFRSGWVFAAAGGVVLLLGAGAYAARAWIRPPGAQAAAAPAFGVWQSSRAPRSVRAPVDVAAPVTEVPTASAQRRTVVKMGTTGANSKATTNAELQLLRTARQNVTRGDYAAALAVIGQHRHRFENGTLVEEREALRVKSLSGMGRHKEAHAAMVAFEARFPHSVFLSTFARLKEADR